MFVPRVCGFARQLVRPEARLAKRTSLFEQASAIAGMFSGYVPAALYSGLTGDGGLSGWRWLFTFDGIISIPIAIWGFFAIPDRPHDTRAFWLKKQVHSSRNFMNLQREADRRVASTVLRG
jgi:MFS transporter, ACS family, pantothenate transporter